MRVYKHNYAYAALLKYTVCVYTTANLNTVHILCTCVKPIQTGRASVALHTVMYFKSKPTEEYAYVLSVGKGKLTVLVPRFGIEGTVSTTKHILHCAPI
jgi:S1 domain